MSDKILAVIPARMGSSRFPGKPLVKILDLPMIEHVRRRVNRCEKIEEVYVATCDQEIFAVVEGYGGKAIMTANTHERCTDRVQEAIQNLDCDIVVIFQSDEPLFTLEVANQLVGPLLSDQKILCTNLLSIITHMNYLSDTSIVKAVLNQKKDVIYFSRAPIPYCRPRDYTLFYRQTGLSAFRKSFLNTFSQLKPTTLEVAESVDFLRIIEHGFPVRGVIYQKQMFGVDEPEHVATIESILQNDQEQKEIYQEILSG